MRVILKPMGLAVVVSAIAGLTGISYINLQRAKTSSAAAASATAPHITRLQIPGLKEADVEDLLGGDFTHAAPFYIMAQGVSGGTRNSGTPPPLLSFICWNQDATAEAELKEDPEATGGAKRLEIRNLTGTPSAQLYTWKPVSVEAGSKYIISCEYKTEGTGSINLDSPRFAMRRAEIVATGGKWKTLQLSLDREKPGEVGVALQYFGSGAQQPLYLRTLRFWRVK